MSSSVLPPGQPDRIARLATGVVGGPRGRHAVTPSGRPHLLLVAALLSLGACLTLALGFLQKSHCVRFGWAVPQVYWKGCYSDLPSYAGNPGLTGGLPYDAGSALGEPVGVGVVLRLLAAFVPADGFARQQGLFVAWAVLAAVLLVVTVLATVWTSRAHPEWAAHVAFSPLVATVGLVSLDLVGVALTSVAMWLWSRGRLTAAGVVFGLAVATRTYPLLVLVVLGILALRAGALRDWARTAGVALVTAVLVVGGVSLAYGTGTLAAYQSWAAATAQLGSPWYVATLWERPIAMGVLTLLAVFGWALAVGAGALLALAAPVRPRIGEIAIVVLVLVLITGKSLPVQSSLWLVPLVAIAGLPWRDHLLWALTEVLYFVAVWLYLGGLDDAAAALPKAWYAAFLVLRLAGLVWLAAAATRQAMNRRDHGTVLDAPPVDEAAGRMAALPDAVVVRYEQ